MNDNADTGTPHSPEEQAPYVEKELHQANVTHVGDYRPPEDPETAAPAGMSMGAVETEVVPVTPAMSGPADLVGEHDQDGQGNETGHTEVGEELYDPRDEITPG